MFGGVVLVPRTAPVSNMTTCSAIAYGVWLFVSLRDAYPGRRRQYLRMHARYTADEKGGAGSNKTRWMIVAGREPACSEHLAREWCSERDRSERCSSRRLHRRLCVSSLPFLQISSPLLMMYFAVFGDSGNKSPKFTIH